MPGRRVVRRRLGTGGSRWRSVGGRAASVLVAAVAGLLMCASLAVGTAPYEQYSPSEPFGITGKTEEKTTVPWDDAIDAHGDIWVTNYEYGYEAGRRIEVFSVGALYQECGHRRDR